MYDNILYVIKVLAARYLSISKKSLFLYRKKEDQQFFVHVLLCLHVHIKLPFNVLCFARSAVSALHASL